MNKRITLKEALNTWQEHGLIEDTGSHIPPTELYELLIQSQETKLREKQINHLTSCPQCLGKIKDMVQYRKEAEAWDISLPKAAATKAEWPKKIWLEGGKYSVTIRRNIHEANRGLVVLEVEKGFQERLEGKSIQMMDGQGLICVEGIIFHGKISQEIDNVNLVDLKRLTVRPGD